MEMQDKTCVPKKRLVITLVAVERTPTTRPVVIWKNYRQQQNLATQTDGRLTGARVSHWAQSRHRPKVKIALGCLRAAPSRPRRYGHDPLRAAVDARNVLPLRARRRRPYPTQSGPTSRGEEKEEDVH